MPDGDRGSVRTIVTWFFVGLLLILCAITIWDVSARNAKYDQRADYNAANHASETESAIERECVGADVSAIRKCIEEKVRAEQESKRSEYDLSAQQAMADWAFGVLAVSFVTLLATIAGVIYVRNTLLETRRLGIIETRAYVGVTDISIEGTDTASPTIIISIKNAGSSPAHKIAITSGYNLNFVGHDPRSDLTKDRTVRGFDIGPGQDFNHPVFIFHMVWKMSKSTMENGAGRFFVYGRIDYSDAFDNPRETAFKFEYHPGPNGIADGKTFSITSEENYAS
ncbi:MULTISPECIES: hypothetical protein [unclassified Mesorhizobium]|uniref:hypothetical protein n=1 Tax=unclassified Mesorhizobium TaxID=325217 RepID=UPI000FD26F64|nr:MULTISPECIES: hypothetical protein [unclassified Mesorhizobium]RVB72319.1 hypothetical protein EN885_29775 [Mesorhizobium sp. M6A.T.Cr.TU.014.01.1.1]RWP71833.1 MAG: hypothetical protein EOR10_29000 [Mesorhizobium sp.]RWP96502.1 MAG: hypothetical protein EOR91_31010 [Mesorhizobium sp.]RWQ07741.1 MAG: hypothetical protein EOR90_09810 [Mesorhizobium sp.]RWQ66371.1 MAG: hypothetical protein EOS86_10295 [Mesorhizobium sp.]